MKFLQKSERKASNRFTHLFGPKAPARHPRPAKVAQVAGSDFQRLMAIGVTAAAGVKPDAPKTAVERRPAAPSPAVYAEAAGTVARGHGALAQHASRPTDGELAAASKILQGAQAHRELEVAERKASAAVMAAKILAAGNFAAVRK